MLSACNRRVAPRVARQQSAYLHMSSAKASQSREELQKAAKQMHKGKMKEADNVFWAEKNLPCIDIPLDHKFHWKDSKPVRQHKKEQQFQYFIQQKYGYLMDKGVKLGFLDKDEVATNRRIMEKRIADPPTNFTAKTSVKLSKIQALSQVFVKDAEDNKLVIEESDTKEQKIAKAHAIVKVLIERANTRVEETIEQKGVTTREEGSAKYKHLKQLLQYGANEIKGSVYNVDVDSFFEEHREDLERASEIGDAKTYIRGMLKELDRRLATHTPENLLGETAELKELGLLAPHITSEVEKELRVALELHDKRCDEYDLRYGQLEVSNDEDDPYYREYERQKSFFTEKATERLQARANEQSGEAEGEEGVSVDGVDAAEVKGVSDSEIGVEKGVSRDEAQSDLKAYINANANTRNEFIDEDTSDPQWPRVVDGLQLDKFAQMRDLKWETFEKPPEAFEVRIMDAFARQRQLREAKENDVTLVPRVGHPSGPSDNSVVKKVLHLYRIMALRQHIKDIKMQLKNEYMRSYRDMDDFCEKHRLDVAYEAEDPWKYRFWEETKLILNNQSVWQTSQKEKYLLNLHKILRQTEITHEIMKKEGVYLQRPDVLEQQEEESRLQAKLEAKRLESKQ